MISRFKKNNTEALKSKTKCRKFDSNKISSISNDIDKLILKKMSSARNKNSRNDETNSEVNFLDENMEDASSVYMEERYTEVVTRKFRGGKSWMVGCETFYTTKRTEKPYEEKRKDQNCESKCHYVNTSQEIETNPGKPNVCNYSQDSKSGDFQSKDVEEVNTLPRLEVYGGARPDVMVMKWHELPVMVDEKDSEKEKNEESLEKENSSSSVVEESPHRSYAENQYGILCHNGKKYSVKSSDLHQKHSVDKPKQRRRRFSAADKKTSSQKNGTRSGEVQRGVRFSDDRRSETGLEFVSTEDEIFEFETRKKNSADRRNKLGNYSEYDKSDGNENYPREDRDGKYNISKRLSVENWLKHSMRYKTHDRFKSDISGIDFIEVNRLPYVDSEPGLLPRRNIGVKGGHSKLSGSQPNLYSAMFSSRDAAFREGPSGRGHFARVFTDDNNEDFFLCASVFLFGHANLNVELRQVIDLFSQRLHVRYPRDSIGPVMTEEKQILSFAALFMTKVEALVRMSSDEYYWKAFDPPGVSRPSRTLHLYYYASNYCDLIVKREPSDDFSWEYD